MNSIKYAGLVLVLASAGMSVEARETKDFSKTYSFDAKGTISVDNVNGDIRITGWDKNEISLTYTIKADSKKALDRVKVKVDHSDSNFDVEVDFESSKSWFGWGDSSGEVDFEIKVPSTASLKTIESVNGDLKLIQMSGDIKADTVNGRIEISGARSDVSVDTVNGDIIINMDRMSSGQRIKGESVNGDIEIVAPADSAFTLRSETLNGDLSNDFGIEVDEGQYVGADMDGDYNGGGAKLVFDTVNGDIEVKKD